MLLVDLPSEVILEILSCIKIQTDLRAVSRTCKKLRSYNKVFQWQSLHVIIFKASPHQTAFMIDESIFKPCLYQTPSMIDQSNTSFKIVAENAPRRLLEACDQGRIPCENVREIMVTSLSPANDFPNLQSDYNMMFARFPRLNVLILDVPTFALKLPSDLPIQTIKADFHYYMGSQKWRTPNESLNVMVPLATLAKLPHLKTIQISGINKHLKNYWPARDSSAYMDCMGEKGSTIEDLRISSDDGANIAVVLALLAWPNALKHLTINLSSMYRPDIPALHATIARHSHSLKTLVISVGRVLHPALMHVDGDSTESGLHGWDFSTFTSMSSLAIQLPRVLDPNISRRLPPHVKHLQFECHLYLYNVKSPWFISLADEKRGKLSCLESITWWCSVGSIPQSKSSKVSQEIGEALGERGVVFTYIRDYSIAHTPLGQRLFEGDSGNIGYAGNMRSILPHWENPIR